MYSWEKALKEEKPRKNPKNPSFSSTLLDEIYRSIDGNDEKDGDFKFHRERSTAVKKHSQNGSRAEKAASAVEDEQMASLKRACLIEKWMEKQVNDKVASRRNLPLTTLLHDDDPLFFSTTSSSSDSSSGGLSSSDTEFFSSAKPSKSCFSTVKKPKPVKTSVKQQQNDNFMDDYKVKQSSKTEQDLIKAKSRAMKIYANLKKVKEPISPGGRLSSFINNLFTSGHSKKTKNICSNGGYEEGNMDRKSKYSTQASSTCSSASSFSRSCLSKTSQNSRTKFNDGAKRTVRFYPVSVIVDEDNRPCGHKQIHDEDSDKFVRPSLSQNTIDAKKTEGISGRLNLKSYQDEKKDTFLLDRMIQDKNFRIGGEILNDFDGEDAASDCSSDLFEIDHLALFGKSRFREELPVYETTHLDTNRAIASGLIR